MRDNHGESMNFRKQLQYYVDEFNITIEGLNYFEIIQRPGDEPRMTLGKKNLQSFLAECDSFS